MDSDLGPLLVAALIQLAGWGAVLLGAQHSRAKGPARGRAES